MRLEIMTAYSVNLVATQFWALQDVSQVLRKAVTTAAPIPVARIRADTPLAFTATRLPISKKDADAAWEMIMVE